MSNEEIINTYKIAKEKYAELGVDVENVLNKLNKISLSIHCWQGDDVAGFEKADSKLSGGGIQVTGNYPGKARNIAELRMDLKKVYSLIPGKHRLNLHAIYGDFGGKYFDRDQISPEHFKGWVDWARENDLKIDFNSTCFSHPMANSGFTLSSKDKFIRDFWIKHVKKAREISAFIGKEQNNPCIHNLWIPDGSKDLPVDRFGYRKILKDSLDDIFSVKYKKSELKDALESKLFGIGSEAFVVGSHEFYLGYVLTHGKMICLDLGHFHPTELVADKVSSILQFSDELLLHISRPVRWDSDHVVTLNDDLKFLSEEVVRSGNIDKIHLGLDFFDASINRIGAWTIGARATLKSLLIAFLEPTKKLKEYEEKSDNFARLALLEELKTMPFGIIWDYYCQKMNVPVEAEIINDIHKYESKVTSKRY